MAELNKVMLIGNLTKDLELRYISSGDAVINFTIATNRKWNSKSGEAKEETSFVGCTAWGKTAELMSKYLNKGDPIFIEGRIKQEIFEHTDGKKETKTKVTVENMQFLGKKKEENKEENT